ncbi:MAG: AMP-binding protein [Nitrospinae bacterium]|nr:AMP-binding protein [Nitrospinota bacterium]
MLRFILYNLCKLFFRVKVNGDISVFTKHKKQLIVANHQSLIDGLLLGMFLPIEPIFVVYSEINKNRFYHWVLSHGEYYTVDPQNPMAMKHVLKVIEEEHRPVVIFPEGRITITGSMMKIYNGSAFIAMKSNATIIPVNINGAVYSYFSYMGRWFPKKLFPQITLTVRPPEIIHTPENKTPKETRRLIGNQLRHIMQEAEFESAPKQQLFSSLIQCANLYGRRKVIIEDAMGNSFSYGRLIKAALALGKIVSRFSREKENIGVLLPNIAPTVGLLYGLIAFKRVPAMLNYSSGISTILDACATAQVKTIITSRAFLEKANLNGLLTVEKNVELLFLEDLKAQFSFFDKVWLIVYALWFPEKAVRISRSDINSPAFVMFTSGSEGKPKGVVLSQKNIISNVLQCVSLIDLTPKDNFLSALPIFHAMGLTATVFLPIQTGSKINLYISPLHYRIIPELVYDKSITVIFGTSTFLRFYARFADPYDFRCARLVIAGAEKLAKDVFDLWQEKFGIRILEGYGATECSPVLSVNTPTDYKPNSVGRLLPGLKAQLKHVDDIHVGGLLHVSGPNVMLGYYRDTNPGVIEEVSSAFGKGWYNTGDVVDLDEENYITITARLKRFAKVAGEMVSLEAVESIALQASPQYIHAAISEFDPERGETIVLCTTSTKLTKADLKKTATNMGKSELEIARKVIIVDEMPRLGSGKVDYATLKKKVFN